MITPEEYAKTVTSEGLYGLHNLSPAELPDELLVLSFGAFSGAAAPTSYNAVERERWRQKASELAGEVLRRIRRTTGTPYSGPKFSEMERPKKK